MRAARAWLLRTAAGATVTLVAACGGGGGVSSTPTPPAVAVTPTPTPVPTPTPAPTPTPTPTPTPVASGSYDTAEYRATVGAVSMNALKAYQAGATGAGIGIAIIDTGIDLESGEFPGRISTASQDVAGNASIDDQGGHGTAVAFTAAGRRNDAGTHGVAFDATVIALRADRPGSCATPSTDDSDGGCAFGTDAITRGVDAARVAGARIINMSLGGSAMPASLQAAIGRATAAGIVVVIAAGNDGTAEPDAFTNVAGTSAGGASVIIAGSVGATDRISSFSDRAGSGAQYYLAAVGSGVRAPDETNTPLIWSGTSFAAPQISGAVALLAQAFPNLTGAQIVDLLLSTARDAGTVGTDSTYGRGILDLTRAFQPVGTATVAGATARASLSANGVLSAPMGDARASGVGAVILDGYSRAFAIDLAATLGRAATAPVLTGALTSRDRQVALTRGATTVAMTLAPARGGGVLIEPSRLAATDADAARTIAGSVTQRIDGATSLAFGYRTGAMGLGAGLVGEATPAFLVAAADGLGFTSAAGAATALRRQVGRWGVTASAESGDVLTPRDRVLPGVAGWRRSGYDRVALGIDRRVGAVAGRLTATRMAEHDTLLGARLDAALGATHATSWFLDAGARADMGAGWTLGGTLRQGWTRALLRGLDGGGVLRTGAWAADVGKDGLWGGDSFGLRVAQPLRVATGGVDLRLPTAWNYASGSVETWTWQRLALAPGGREIDVEARYARRLAGGDVQTNLFWRHDPGNVAALAPDYGVALRWSRGW